MSEDRFRDLSPTEQRIATMRRDGYDVVDRQGRPTVPLGNGPESALARATYAIQVPRVPKLTRAITSLQMKTGWAAVATANYQGMVLNTFLTVAWRVADKMDDRQAAKCHDKFRERMRIWYRDKSKLMPAGQEVRLAEIWVKECGPILGLHSHFLLHVPVFWFPDFRRWVRKAAHDLVEAPAVSLDTVASKARLTHTSSLHDDVARQWRVFQYLIKGVDPEATFSFGDLDEYHGKHLVKEFAGIRARHQGAILGKRFGTSPAIGKANQPAFLASYWDHSLQGGSLPFDDHFLRAGALARMLSNIDT